MRQVFTLATIAALAMALTPMPGAAQHLRRTDDISQAALIDRGLSVETTCRGEQTSRRGGARGGLTVLTDLGAGSTPPVSLAGSLAGVVARRRDMADTSVWRGAGIAQLRLHGRHTGCHFDWRARVLGSTRGRVGGDATLVGSLPGALGGALHLYGDASAASSAAASEGLDAPRHVDVGGAYTTFNLYRTLFPALYSRAALDVRLRLSAGASFAYGEARRRRGQSAVPDLSAIFVGKIEEVLHGGVLYSLHVVPNNLPGTRLTEHTVTLLHGFRSGGGPSGPLLMRSPYVTARYSARRVGSLYRDREVALTAGLTLF